MGARETLIDIADAYAGEFPNDPELQINDCSLVRGGLFDIRAGWRTPHQTHREGLDADVRSRFGAIPVANRERFVRICAENNVGAVLENRGGNNEHYHLNF